MMAETKTCIACRSEIHAKAVICPHCHSEVRYHFFLEEPLSTIYKLHRGKMALDKELTLICPGCRREQVYDIQANAQSNSVQEGFFRQDNVQGMGHFVMNCTCPDCRAITRVLITDD